MSDEDALLAAIREHPDEDTPRLAYADWLDEHATTDAQRARAEFLRVQIEIVRLYPDCDRHPERYRRLEKREASLLRRHKKAWLAAFTDAPYANASFTRGLLSALEFAASKCVSTPRPRWHREPFAWVKLHGNAAHLRALCTGWLDGIRDLDIELKGTADADTVADAVAGSGCAEALRRLSFWNDGLSDRGLRALAAGRFTALEELSLRGQFTPVAWAELLAAPATALVTNLTIGHRAPWQTADANRPGPALADALTDAPLHARLKSLWLGECRLGSDGFTRLASGRFGRLEQLDIDYDRLDVAAANALGRGDFPALTDLRLSHLDMTDEVLVELVGAPLMTRLEQITLSSNDLTAASVEALASCGRTTKLSYLDIGFNEIGDAGMAALAKAPLPSLVELHLSGCELTDSGADAIAGAPWAGQLKTLFLSYNRQISESKAEELTKRFGSVLLIKTN